VRHVWQFTTSGGPLGKGARKLHNSGQRQQTQVSSRKRAKVVTMSEHPPPSLAAIVILAPDLQLQATEFGELSVATWGRSLDIKATAGALAKTLNITARDQGKLVGCVRILTDGYLFGTIPEMSVHPDYQHQGLGKRLLEAAWEISPTNWFIGSQPGNEAFFEKCGFSPSLKAFHKRKP
jgi:ribosomal protein S18 acetylase RimI-like enzyme